MTPDMVDNPMRAEQRAERDNATQGDRDTEVIRPKAPSSPPRPLSPQRPVRMVGRTSAQVTAWDRIVTGSPERTPRSTAWESPAPVASPTKLTLSSPIRAMYQSPPAAFSPLHTVDAVPTGMSSWQKDNLLQVLRIDTSAPVRAPGYRAAPQRAQMQPSHARAISANTSVKPVTVMSPTGRPMRLVGGVADSKWAAKVKAL